MDVETMLRFIVHNKLPRYSWNRTVLDTAKSGQVVTGLDFTTDDTNELAEMMLMAVSKGYKFRNKSDNTDRVRASFFSFIPENQELDWVFVEGKITKVGLKLHIEVLRRVASHDGKTVSIHVPHTVFRFGGVYISPKNTTIEFVDKGRYHGNMYIILEKVPGFKSNFAVTQIPNFEGYTRKPKPVVSEEDVKRMTEIATETLALYVDEQQRLRKGKEYGQYCTADNVDVFICHNQISTMLEWKDEFLYRVTVYDNKIIFSTWKRANSALQEFSRKMDKSEQTLKEFERAKLTRKLTDVLPK